MITNIHMRRITGGELLELDKLIEASIGMAMGPNGTPALLAAVMCEVRQQQLQVWIIQGEREEKKTLLGFMTTRIANDKRNGRKTLIVETISVVDLIGLEHWKAELPKLLAFARENNCTVIEADIITPQMMEIVRSLGFVPVSAKVLMEVT